MLAAKARSWIARLLLFARIAATNSVVAANYRRFSYLIPGKRSRSACKLRQERAVLPLQIIMAMLPGRTSNGNGRENTGHCRRQGRACFGGLAMSYGLGRQHGLPPDARAQFFLSGLSISDMRPVYRGAAIHFCRSYSVLLL